MKLKKMLVSFGTVGYIAVSMFFPAFAYNSNGAFDSKAHTHSITSNVGNIQEVRGGICLKEMQVLFTSNPSGTVYGRVIGAGFDSDFNWMAGSNVKLVKTSSNKIKYFKFTGFNQTCSITTGSIFLDSEATGSVSLAYYGIEGTIYVKEALDPTANLTK